MACVYIPVQNSEEEVRVALDQLPCDATDILDILKAEQAPLDLWLIIAREYFKQGKIEQFRKILEEGSSPEIDEYYADVRYERIVVLNFLGAYYSYLGKIETMQREKEDHFNRPHNIIIRLQELTCVSLQLGLGKAATLNMSRRRIALSESDDDEPVPGQPEPYEMESDGEVGFDAGGTVDDE